MKRFFVFMILLITYLNAWPSILSGAEQNPKTQLIRLISENHIDEAKELLKSGAPFPHKETWGYYVEEKIADLIKTDKEFVRLAVSSGLSLNQEFKQQYPVIEAINSGSLDRLRLYVELGGDVNLSNSFESPLVISGKATNPNIYNYLLEMGAKYRKSELWQGKSAFLKAGETGDLERIRQLIHAGVLIDTKNYNNNTVLWIATENGYLDVVTYLVENGADLFETEDGEDLLMLSAWYGHDDVAFFLIDRGLDLNAKNNEGESALLVANRGMFAAKTEAHDRYLQLIGMLIDKGAEVNSRDNDGLVSISYAVASGNTEAVELLLANGANPNAKGKWKKTLVLDAYDRGFLEIINILLYHVADLGGRGFPKSWSLDMAYQPLVPNKTVVSSGKSPLPPQGDLQQVFDSEIMKITISPDGQFALIATSFKLHFINLKTGREVWQHAVTRGVEGQFSPDGKSVLGASRKAAFLLDAGSGNLIKQFDGHTGNIERMTISKGGRYLATASGDDKTVHLWDLNTGEEIYNFSIDAVSYNFNFLFSPDEKYFLICDKKNRQVYNLSQNKILWSKESESRSVFLADGSFLLSANTGGFFLEQIETGEVIVFFEGEGCVNLSLSPDLRFLVAGNYNDLQVYDLKVALKTKRFDTPLVTLESSCDNVQFSPDIQFILSGISSLIVDDNGASKDAVLIETATGKEFTRIKGHAGTVTSAVFLTGGQYLLTGSNDRTIKFWDIKTGQEINPQQKASLFQGPQLVVRMGHTSKISAFALSPDEKHFVTGGEDRVAILWELATGREIHRFEEHEKKIVDVALSPDMKHMATVNEEGVRVFDLATGQILHQFFIMAAKFVSFFPDGQRLMVGSEGLMQIETSIWNLANGERIKQHSLWGGEASIKAFSTDGRLVVGSKGGDSKEGSVAFGTVGKDGNIQFGKEFVGHKKFLMSAVLSPSNQLAVTTGFDNSIIVWDVKNKKKRHQISAEIEKHLIDGETIEMSRPVGEICIAPDEKTFLEYNYDKIKIWDIKTGKLLRERLFEVLEEGINSPVKITFTADGDIFFVVKPNGIISVYDFDSLNSVKDVRALGSVGAVHSVAFSNSGDKLLVGSSGQAGRSVAQSWSLRKGEEKERINGRFVVDYNPNQGPFFDSPQYYLDTRAAFIPDGRILLQNNRGARVISSELSTDLAMPTLAGDAINGMVVSSDGRFAALAVGWDVRFWDIREQSDIFNIPGNSKNFRTRFLLQGMALSSVAISPDNLLAAIAGAEKLDLWDVVSKEKRLSFDQSSSWASSLAFSLDGKMLATGHDLAGGYVVRLWEVKSGQLIKTINGHKDTVTAVQFQPGAGKTLLSASKDGTARLWDVANGNEIMRFSGDSGGVTSAAFSPNGTHIVTGHSNGNTLLWQTDSDHWLAKIISFLDGGWVVVDPDGRYDSHDPGDLPGISWVMPDAPFVPLPIELFMREYYEPRLLSRIIGGEKFKQITALTDLNRTQPEVAIMQVFKNEEKEDQVSVTIKIADVVKNKTDKNGTSFEQWSGAYDLRVFRDGQLVGYFPDEAGKIEVDHATKSRLVTFNDIKLPSGTKNDSITFSAYAFNKDKVKSTTAKYEFPITKSLGKRRSRAYIIAIGVNAHENPSWDLRYAANDAVAINSIVKNQLEKTGVFDEIISIPLISRYSSDTTPKKKLEANPVTKAMIKEVFARLAGETTGSEKLLKIIPNAVNLKQATPDDMLLISYSGHGLADENRQFHLFPYDIGMGSNRVVDDELLHHTISSDNLSLWLRDVDAGEIIMIIDACNSAASVEGEDFKPGPMGSRGLGQLAYDKRMRILAASQAEAVALESDLIKHGVLTYALIQEGLEAERADHEPKDKRIFAGEWLTYGEARVPELYRLIRSGQADKLANSVGQKGQIYHFTPDSINKKERSINVQQPTLFDFTKNESDFVLTILK